MILGSGTLSSSDAPLDNSETSQSSLLRYDPRHPTPSLGGTSFDILFPFLAGERDQGSNRILHKWLPKFNIILNFNLLALLVTQICTGYTCADLRIYGQICADLCRTVQNHAELGRSLRFFAHLLRSVQICAEPRRSAQVCRSAQICLDLCTSVQICAQLRNSAQCCADQGGLA